MNPQTQDKIDELCQQGDGYLNAGAFDDALNAYQSAADLIPDPKINWPQSTWIFTAIGEAFFFKQEYIRALDYLKAAVGCPDGLGNPLIHLRLGQAYYELYDFDKSADELTRAYMSAGEGIFQEDDPKYLRFLRSRIIT
jgi:tetratricopeptide (TPR) repeat protein